MANFAERLARVLAEMPMSYHIAGDKDAQGEPWKYRPNDNSWSTRYDDVRERTFQNRYDPDNLDRNSQTEPLEKQFAAWASPKFLNVLSQKLSRLTGYNLLLYVGGNVKGHDHLDPDMPEVGDKARQPYRRQQMATRTGINPTVLAHSIVVNITGNGGGQDTASPWILLHQVAEAVVQNSDVYDIVYQTTGIKTVEETSPMWDTVYEYILRKYWSGKEKPIHNDLGGGNISHNVAFSQLFKFKSATRASEGVDYDQELLTEFLWHGGRIRMNRPDFVPPRVLERAKEAIENICRALLDGCVGRVLSNNLGYDRE